jgi:murein L,D-transpeptidase YcbB/YkuD
MRPYPKPIFLKTLAAACAWLYVVASPCPSLAETVSERMAAQLSRQGNVFLYEEPLHQVDAVRAFYRDRQYVPVWDAVSARTLQEAVLGADVHGLAAQDYHVRATELAREKGDLPAIELLATDAYMTLASHLFRGRLDASKMEPTWTAKERPLDLPRYLEDALERNEIKESLDALAPKELHYSAMKAGLLHYRELACTGGYPQVDRGGTLKLGMRGPRVRQLKARLAASGDYVPKPSLRSDFAADAALGFMDEDMFDAELEEALKRFQKRANLEQDGEAGPETLKTINRTAEERAAQLRVNMERWRWMPEDMGARHIRINIADYRLEAVEDGGVARVHDVEVGRTYRQTPIFSSRMSYLIFNPWWMTPEKLAREDKLPLFREEPERVEQAGFEVLDRSGNKVDPKTIDWSKVSEERFPYSLRQRPGKDNALGQVKFIFPNPHDVYLHDTPARGFFSRTRRDFSSGCVRVKDPFDLAEWALSANGGWNRARIDAVVESEKETRVALKKPVPVYLLYMTAVAEENGGVRFIDDIYGRDPAILAALDLPLSPPE